MVGKTKRAHAASIRVFVAATIGSLASGCFCTARCQEAAVAHEFEVGPPGAVTVRSDTAVCSGVLIESEPLSDGRWRHRALTAKHCFSSWEGKNPTADLRVPLDGGYVKVLARLEAWGEGEVHRSFWLGISPGHDESEWESSDDWAILTFTSEQRFQTIPLARTTKLRNDDRVVLLSYLDTDHTWKLIPHEHVFAWGTVPVNVPQEGHSGAPIVANGEVAAITVRAYTQSIACRLVTGCRYRAALYVSADTIRASAHRQGFLLAGEYNPPRP